MSSFKKTINGSNGWHGNNNNYVFDDREEAKVKKNTIRIRDRFEINEWTFSLFLFCFSLSIVIGKLFLNYGEYFFVVVFVLSFNVYVHPITYFVNVYFYHVTKKLSRVIWHATLA